MTEPDPLAARSRYDRLARRYDRSLLALRPWLTRYRRQAVAALGLQSGDTVFDVGAGTGASLDQLSRAVGPDGRVVAIEPSDAMREAAQQRARDAALSNVQFVAVTAQEVTDLPRGDAALFFLTHDIVRAPVAVDNIFEQLRAGARVVCFGAQAGGPTPLQGVVRRFTAQFVTTLDGLDAPWEYLKARLEDFHRHDRAAGIAYLASGHVRRRRSHG